MEKVHNLSFANDLAEIPRLAEAIEKFGAQCGLSTGDIYKVNLALDELLTNLISYAYPEGERHIIRLQLSLNDDFLTTELIDDANSFDPLREAKPAVLEGPLENRPIGGLGLHFVRTFMDKVSYQRVGETNHLTLVKRLGARSAQ